MDWKRVFKFCFWGGLTAAVLFLPIGYFLSDDFYFRRVFAKESIENVDDAFEYFVSKNKYPTGHSIRGCTPRYLIEVHSAEHGLYCDEGAVVLATFAQILGYETRLLDLLDEKGISRHTVLETKKDGKAWLIYDTLKNKKIASRDELPKWTSSFRIRKFPRPYNFVIQRNYFLKQIALKLRKIPG